MSVDAIMNKTRTLAIVAILTAVILVVGVTFAAISTPSAFAYQKKRSQDGSKNDNTITPQKSKQGGIVSGFDNAFNQELQTLLCTHPSATCSTEGSEGVTTTASASRDGAQLGPEGIYLLGDTKYTVSQGPSGSSCNRIINFQPLCIPLPTP
jgi:hypothetical protein